MVPLALAGIRRRNSGRGRPVLLRVCKPGIAEAKERERRPYVPLRRPLQCSPRAEHPAVMNQTAQSRIAQERYGLRLLLHQAARRRCRRARSRSWAICRLSQNSAEVPKRSPSRMAVSADIARSPATMSVTRLDGTPGARARARPYRPSGTQMCHWQSSAASSASTTVRSGGK